MNTIDSTRLAIPQPLNSISFSSSSKQVDAGFSSLLNGAYLNLSPSSIDLKTKITTPDIVPVEISLLAQLKQSISLFSESVLALRNADVFLSSTQTINYLQNFTNSFNGLLMIFAKTLGLEDQPSLLQSLVLSFSGQTQSGSISSLCQSTPINLANFGISFNSHGQLILDYSFLQNMSPIEIQQHFRSWLETDGVIDQLEKLLNAIDSDDKKKEELSYESIDDFGQEAGENDTEHHKHHRKKTRQLHRKRYWLLSLLRWFGLFETN